MSEPSVTSKVVTEKKIVVHLKSANDRRMRQLRMYPGQRLTRCGRIMSCTVVDEAIEHVNCKTCLRR